MGGGGGILESTGALLLVGFSSVAWTLVGFLIFGGCLAFLLERFCAVSLYTIAFWRPRVVEL